MRHSASPLFWDCYNKLPASIQHRADEYFKLMKANPRHPSLHLKQVGHYWSVRVGRKYRSAAVQTGEVLLWFWIGTHAEYDNLVGHPR